MTCPCQNCADRTARCHADCRRYKEWLAWREEHKRPQIRAAIMMAEYYFGFSDKLARNDFRRKKVGRK